MDIGTGIAVAGVWGFAAVCGGTKYLDGAGFILAIIVAFITTLILIIE